MKNIKHYIFVIILFLSIGSCNYLDVVPDNLATIDNAFTMRSTAEKYLFTCYRYLPDHGNASSDPAIAGCDEYWFLFPYITTTGWNSAISIAQGFQRSTSPYLDYWSNRYSSSNPFRGIRDCNIFLENIEDVIDISADEKTRWIAEVKFLKAYYHFWLFRMYGAIPLIKENLPISASVEDVKVYRQPVDDCINYIVELLDEAATGLPDKIDFETTELGRITKPVCLSVKAHVLVTAASPLFNGNPDYAGIVDNRNIHLFPTKADNGKWEKAVIACKEAIELCEGLGYKLYDYSNQPFQIGTLSDSTETLIAIRNSFSEKWNGEIIWANTQSLTTDAQRNATPPGVIASKYPATTGNLNTLGKYSPPIKIAEMFYSKNGLPISEDKTYNYADRYKLRVVTDEYKYYLQPGYTTVGLHFDREPRFYSCLAFDGGLWYGQGSYDDRDQYLMQCRAGQLQVAATTNRTGVTGYWPKKLVNYLSAVATTGSGYTLRNYPWPVMRLSDLYLLYAEALNEAYGPSGSGEANGSPYLWINKVRGRAGLPTVEDAWQNFAIHPTAYQQQSNLREIIHQERLNELAFEGQRFWDLRRWKTAHIELNKPISGWDYQQSAPEYYYRPRVLYNQTFMIRDYLWPIDEDELLINRNLVQNYGY
ncbi:MAG: starch-binding protein [Bacteroidetes bacterium GWF2_42_66]|nr:MAG: starch-binding protein [Bacteroidetes bacterium GWA2_42_15]OFY00574.1 MAG: starch-binding protein [Bacteroidetes bacterium GWE2_42_39]OFY42308.1 MAG: starch-binding protein [Bacteroidetes bacterium GWF2_42_66]HAZ02061.1 RagB/SusD family nutrient uptake outer membrane protein [Marinilabiliales bacterium]HBL76461.1 RagB/SusD family nutrient uptake outer membrane protein [Prolixibacteraceae bacterium]